MVRTQADADEALNRASSVVSTIVRAHQRAAGARRTGAPADESTTAPSAGPAPGRAPASPGMPGSRPPEFDREVYEQRTTVERCVNRLKQRRGIATR
ncbi:hypothetical protein GCM10023097_35170 [Streptomyces collinus]